MPHTAATELKLEKIMSLMREWKYDPSARRALSKEWNCTEDWVTDLASEASKRVLAEVQNPDHVKLNVGLAMIKILRDGLESFDAKDRRNAIEAAKTWAAMVGVNAPHKSEIAITDGDASPAVARSIMNELFPVSDDSEERANDIKFIGENDDDLPR